MRSFAENLRRIRKASGLTQEQLAQNISVSRQTISAWERGRTEPDIDSLIALSESMNVSAEELILGRKTGQHSSFQKKYLVCTIVSLSLALFILLLHLTLAPYLKRLVNTLWVGAQAYFIIFQLLTPFLGYASLGVGAASSVASFIEVGLRGRCRQAVFILGIAAALPSVLVILDYLIWSLLPGYRAPIAFFLFVSTSKFPALKQLMFDFLPIISGILLFFGLNNGTKATSSRDCDFS